ncbi:hypothetical protein GCM10010429_01180 [Micromonospora olivasterospora]
MTAMQIPTPRLLAPPALLGRVAGIALLHWGVVDGPNGLSLVVEVIDEEQTGALQEGAWKDPGIDTVVITATGRDGEPVPAKDVMRSGGRGFQRWTASFQRHGGPVRTDPAAPLTVTARPLDLTRTIDLTQSPG